MCCVLPGIYLSARLSYAGMMILDNPEIDILEAIKKSWNMTEGNVWNLILLSILFLFVVLAGLVCCCVGFFFAAAITLFAEAIVFYALKPNLEMSEAGTSAEKPMDNYDK